MCATNATLNTDYTFKSVATRYEHTCGLIDGNIAGQTDGEALYCAATLSDNLHRQLPNFLGKITRPLRSHNLDV